MYISVMMTIKKKLLTLYRIIPNKGTTLMRAPPIVWPKQRVPKNGKSLHNSLNNCPIFNPKPPLERSEPQLQPCIITCKLVRSPVPLLGIIRYNFDKSVLGLTFVDYQTHIKVDDLLETDTTEF